MNPRRVALLGGKGRVALLGGTAAVAAVAGGLYRYPAAGSDVAASRASIAESGKQACYAAARADARNATMPGAKLTAYCACTLDRAVASLTDGEVRAGAAAPAVVDDAVRAKLAAAAGPCRAATLE